MFGDRDQRLGRAAGERVFWHFSCFVPGRRRHAAFDQLTPELNAQPAEARKDDVSEAANKADAGASIAVVPLTIPLLTGPATISTMVIYAEKTRHWWELAVLVGYGVVVALVTYAVFSASGRIARVLGQTGINIMTRLMGLILAALAVELLADGLIKLFPVLASHLSN